MSLILDIRRSGGTATLNAAGQSLVSVTDLRLRLLAEADPKALTRELIEESWVGLDHLYVLALARDPCPEREELIVLLTLCNESRYDHGWKGYIEARAAQGARAVQLCRYLEELNPLEGARLHSMCLRVFPDSEAAKLREEVFA